MKKLIELDAAIDALENIDCSDGIGISALKCDAVDDAVNAINALPTAQPTLYGYDLRSLIIFADAVKKKGITESEIEDFARNASAAWEYAWEEFQRTQKEALDSIMRGEHHED